MVDDIFNEKNKTATNDADSAALVSVLIRREMVYKYRSGLTSRWLNGRPKKYVTSFIILNVKPDTIYCMILSDSEVLVDRGDARNVTPPNTGTLQDSVCCVIDMWNKDVNKLLLGLGLKGL